VADLRFLAAEYPDNQSYPRLFEEVLDGVAALPGVDGTSLARGAPGDGGTFSWRFEVQGDVAAPTEYPAADGVPVASDYFRVMGIELLQGREFLREENRFGVEPVVIVNETFARRRLGADPIGQRIRIEGDDPWLTVVGVVEDTYIGSSSGGIAMEEAARDQIYVSWGIAPYSFGTLLVGTERDPDQLVQEVRTFLRESGLNIPVYNVDRLSNVIANSTWSFGLFGSAFGVFGGVALFLAAVGLYGVIASTVRQRRPELSIRMALGAGPGAIFRLVFRQVGKLLLVGIGVGLVLSTALGRGIEATLFGVGTTDPIVYAIVLVTVTGTGLLAILLPARGATRANLVDVLLR
jgi:ABC-type antimicrobial peptide transport system permease subunit